MVLRCPQGHFDWFHSPVSPTCRRKETHGLKGQSFLSPTSRNSSSLFYLLTWNGPAEPRWNQTRLLCPQSRHRWKHFDLRTRWFVTAKNKSQVKDVFFLSVELRAEANEEMFSKYVLFFQANIQFGEANTRVEVLKQIGLIRWNETLLIPNNQSKNLINSLVPLGVRESPSHRCRLVSAGRNIGWSHWPSPRRCPGTLWLAPGRTAPLQVETGT